MSDPVAGFVGLVRSLREARCHFLLIGVAGANLYAHSGSTIFSTLDHDLFLPADPDNCLAAWRVAEATGLDLLCGREPLDQPRDRWLAERVVEQRALVRATDGAGLQVDLTLVMAGFDFETVWAEHRLFRVMGVEVPVARLSHIIRSKALADRPKDRLFLAAHEDALRQLGELDD